MSTAVIVFLALFVFVALLGLFGSRWRAGDLSQLNEWGLGGRSFGTLITWFLLGGDLYTAYTFIAVPALMFGAGAAGFFAIPYAALLYPVLFLTFPRLWSVAHKHGYITAADFVRGRFGHRGLALAIALTGLVGMLPYLALQLVGMQVVIAALGLDRIAIIRSYAGVKGEFQASRFAGFEFNVHIGADVFAVVSGFGGFSG